MKLSFGSLLRLCALALLFNGAVQIASAQNSDPFIAQLTDSAQNSYVGDISADGRFVVVESSGDIGTDRTARSNSDGNREIFLIDYAQRRIFQLTDTRSLLANAANSSTDRANIVVEISNNRPVLSRDGRFIVFSSNADTPAGFNPNTAAFGDAGRTALRADANQEIFIYQIPAVTAANLSSGVEATPEDLRSGAFTRITTTTASRAPRAGTATISPFVADDNRSATISDDGSIIAFVSTRSLVGTTNSDGTPEIFLFNRTTSAFTQATSTDGTVVANMLDFNENPNISGNDASTLAFVSNANLTGSNSDRNAEIFVASYNGAAVNNLRQITSTASPTNDPGGSVNILSPGRRMSRNGNLLAFESTANLEGNGSTNSTTTTVFVANLAGAPIAFTPVGPRATSGGDVLRFPTFTGDNARLVFTSILNFRADGTAPTTAADGLNPDQRAQIFSTSTTTSGTTAAFSTFNRLTNSPAATGLALQAFTSDTEGRIAFSNIGELGGGNTDQFNEAFYLLTRAVPTPNPTPIPNALSYFTGASERPVVAASPSPTPTPTPPAVSGLAPGMLTIARGTNLAPAPQNAGGQNTETTRRPALPIELNNVVVGINGAAAGLYFVSPTQINFVVPVGLGAGTFPLVVNNNGAVTRTTITLNPAQPDLFVRNDVPGNRAAAFNTTVCGAAGTTEPFTVTTTRPRCDGSGGTETVPTQITFLATGVRNVQTSQITVTLGTGTTAVTLSGANIVSVGRNGAPGFDQIVVTLPANAPTGDVPVVVTVTISGQTFTSRPADAGAPLIRIN